MSRVTVITGGSSGIGKACAEYFASKGDVVYELSRREAVHKGITHITADVCDEHAVKAAIDEVYAKEGRLDVLVCCAGFGISGAVEHTDIADAQRQLDVNFFGCVRCIKAALAYLRMSKGTIINISSVGGPLALPFQAFYSCSKTALNALTLALANEVRPFGVRVCAVLPGDVRTGFTDAREKSDTDALYGSAVNKSLSTMEKDERSGMSPVRIARKVYSLSKKKHPKPLSTVGLQYKLFLLLNKILPARMVNRIVGMIYA